jgi:aryl-alcohol dehydrogenase-like predicted oxidoreductase
VNRRTLGDGFEVSAIGLGCMRVLNALFPPGAAAGDRYLPAGMQTVER